MGQITTAVLDARQFGCRPDGTSDNTAAIRAACAALQRMGGGRLVFPAGPRPYNFTAVPGTAIATLERLDGVVIECANGATLNDTASYTGRAQSELFKFLGCRNIVARLRVSSRPQVTLASRDVYGLFAVVFEEGCVGADIDIDMTGGLSALTIRKVYSDPMSYQSRDVRGMIRARNTFYPYQSQYGSQNVTLDIYADTCGRNFVLYGSKAQRLTIHSKNQQVSQGLGAYRGFGCEDIDLTLIDRDSTQGLAAAPFLEIGWSDSTPATHRNLRIHVDVRNPPEKPFGHLINFNKVSDGGSTLDTAGRGHVLDGFDLSGSSDYRGARDVNHFTMSGSFAAPDKIQRVRVHDLFLRGQNLLDIRLNVLQDIAVFQNVNTEHNIQTSNGSNGLVQFIGCTARNFLERDDRHEYRDSHITTGEFQGYGPNKRFIGTTLPDGTRKSGENSLKATKKLAGDLSGMNRLFTLSAVGAGVLLRLNYRLISDETASGACVEESGTVTVSAILAANGIWGSYEKPRTEDLCSVTVSLVNGDADGAHLAVACATYDNSNARAEFELEALSMVEGFTVCAA